MPAWPAVTIFSFRNGVPGFSMRHAARGLSKALEHEIERKLLRICFMEMSCLFERKGRCEYFIDSLNTSGRLKELDKDTKKDL